MYLWPVPLEIAVYRSAIANVSSILQLILILDAKFSETSFGLYAFQARTQTFAGQWQNLKTTVKARLGCLLIVG